MSTLGSQERGLSPGSGSYIPASQRALSHPVSPTAGELQGSPLVLEKDDSEDCCGDQEERSSDMMSHVINCLFLVYFVMMQMLR